MKIKITETKNDHFITWGCGILAIIGLGGLIDLIMSGSVSPIAFFSLIILVIVMAVICMLSWTNPTIEKIEKEIEIDDECLNKLKNKK